MKNFRTYQLAKELFHSLKHVKVKGAMHDQLDRASLSIVLNLAEGSAKTGLKDRRKYFVTAMGSLREVQAIMDVLDNKEMLAKIDSVAACLHKLIQTPGPGPWA